MPCTSALSNTCNCFRWVNTVRYTFAPNCQRYLPRTWLCSKLLSAEVIAWPYILLCNLVFEIHIQDLGPFFAIVTYQLWPARTYYIGCPSELTTFTSQQPLTCFNAGPQERVRDAATAGSPEAGEAARRLVPVPVIRAALPQANKVQRELVTSLLATLA